MRLFALFLLIALPAQASLFGLPSSPCGQPGMHYDAKNQVCKYCLRGQEMIGESKCLYAPRLGSRCEKGNNAYYDPSTGLCMVCPAGKYLVVKEKRCN